jgi:hypothetical protein
VASTIDACYANLPETQKPLHMPAGLHNQHKVLPESMEAMRVTPQKIHRRTTRIQSVWACSLRDEVRLSTSQPDQSILATIQSSDLLMSVSGSPANFHSAARKLIAKKYKPVAVWQLLKPLSVRRQSTFDLAIEICSTKQNG